MLKQIEAKRDGVINIDKCSISSSSASSAHLYYMYLFCEEHGTGENQNMKNPCPQRDSNPRPTRSPAQLDLSGRCSKWLSLYLVYMGDGYPE